MPHRNVSRCMSGRDTEPVTEASMPSRPKQKAGERQIPPFEAAYAPADEAIAERLLADPPRPPDAERRIDERATRLVRAIRAGGSGLGGIEDFLREYSLSTREGLALMVLAEALLRVPDSATADRLIEDKLAAADWSHRHREFCHLCRTAHAQAAALQDNAMDR